MKDCITSCTCLGIPFYPLSCLPIALADEYLGLKTLSRWTALLRSTNYLVSRAMIDKINCVPDRRQTRRYHRRGSAPSNRVGFSSDHKRFILVSKDSSTSCHLDRHLRRSFCTVRIAYLIHFHFDLIQSSSRLMLESIANFKIQFTTQS